MMKRFKRIFLIVLDSVGVGHAKDAAKFNDLTNPNTLLDIDKATNGLKLPNLERLGLGYLDDYKFIKKENAINKSYILRLNETSNGKDTMTGHWEMMGINTIKPFKTFFENGFPKELIEQIELKTNHKVIGNYATSGTEIIKQLGERQLKTKELIVYTSSDSVLQVAAHEDVINIDELYKICQICREITMKDEWKVGRIIARPFIGNDANSFVRTKKRHDYALSPSSKTYLDHLKENGYDVISIGKINDIFNSCGITEAYKTVSNHDGMEKTQNLAKNSDFNGLCFVNLVDFDSEYGHRRNVNGYKECLEEFDKDLGSLIQNLNENDLLVLTADHGNDPIAPGSDHTREQVPAIFYSKVFTKGTYIGESDTFALLGSTIAANFNIYDETLLNDDISPKLI